VRVAVIIPALNEEESLPSVLADLPSQLPGARVEPVLVVDNGSTDNTAQVAASCGAVVLHQPKRGYGNACLAGLAHLSVAPPDAVVILDADYSDHPEDLACVLAPLLSGEADMVLGDRTGLASPGSLLPQQRLGNALATRLIRLRTGHRYRDMGPFRAITWEALSALKMSDPTWGWNVEMQMRAIQQGLRVREVPVRYRPRIGQSKISGTVRGSLKAGGRILWAVWRYG
jgi:glycosyltransferase involved in cell wall biosynthesis